MTKGKSFAEQAIIQAEKALKAALAALGLPIRGSYSPGEVCAVLGISSRTFERLIDGFERDANGKVKTPTKLESFILRSNHRVTYLELVDFLRRNNVANRKLAAEATQCSDNERHK